MDLNLLPQDLRSKEEKERQRIKKQPRAFEVELYSPAKEKAVSISKADTLKPSWQEKIFGITNNVDSKLTQPKTDSVNNKTTSSDWLKSPKIPALSAQSKTTLKKSGFWSSLLGRPVSPIVYNTPTKATASLIAKQDASHRQEIKSEKIAIDHSKVKQQSVIKQSPIKKSAKRPKSDSWRLLLKGLFSFSKPKDLDLRFASEDLQPVIPKIPQSLPPAVPEKPKDHPAKAHIKTVKKSAYHLAPKREKNNSVNVNLIPGELSTQSSLLLGEIKFLIVSILIPVLFITIGYGVLFFLQNQANDQLINKKQELQVLEKGIGDFLVKEKQHNHFSGRLLAIKKIYADKIIWSNFFSYLEKYTLDGVYFTNLAADTSGVLILPGIADNYSVLAKQLAVFRDADDFLKDFKISNSQLYSEGKAGVVGVSFQLRLNLRDDLLKKIKQ